MGTGGGGIKDTNEDAAEVDGASGKWRLELFLGTGEGGTITAAAAAAVAAFPAGGMVDILYAWEAVFVKTLLGEEDELGGTCLVQIIILNMN